MPTWTFKNRKGTVFMANQQKMDDLRSKFVLVNDFFAHNYVFPRKKLPTKITFAKFLPNRLKGKILLLHLCFQYLSVPK